LDDCSASGAALGRSASSTLRLAEALDLPVRARNVRLSK